MRTYYVADWMSTPPLLARPTTTLDDAQKIMAHRHVRRLPVVQDGRLVGILTWGDLRAARPSAATTLSVYEWRALLDRATIAEYDPLSDHDRAGCDDARSRPADAGTQDRRTAGAG